MKVICAWCNKDLGVKGDKPGITHGICDPCKAKLHEEGSAKPAPQPKREKAPHQHYVVVHLPGGKRFRWYTCQKVGDTKTKLSGGSANHLARKISLSKRFSGFEVRSVRVELETKKQKVITFLNGNATSKE